MYGKSFPVIALEAGGLRDVADRRATVDCAWRPDHDGTHGTDGDAPNPVTRAGWHATERRTRPLRGGRITTERTERTETNGAATGTTPPGTPRRLARSPAFDTVPLARRTLSRVARRRFAAARARERTETQEHVFVARLRFCALACPTIGRQSRPTCDASCGIHAFPSVPCVRWYSLVVQRLIRSDSDGETRCALEADRSREPIRRVRRRAPPVRARRRARRVRGGHRRPRVRRRGGDRSAAARAAARAGGALAGARRSPHGLPDTTPRVTADERLRAGAARELVDACDGFLRRAAIEASLTRDERLEILRGMVLTRATDNRLKTFFTGGEIRYGAAAFQGKGFRSLGQEAIYARRHPAAPRRGVPQRGRRLDRRRHRPGDPRSRRHARHASRDRHRDDGAERADGEGRPAARRQGPRTSAISAGAFCRRPRR